MYLAYDCVRIILSYVTLETADLHLGSLMKTDRRTQKGFLINNCHLLRELGWKRSFVIESLVSYPSLHEALKYETGMKLLKNFRLSDLMDLKVRKDCLIDFLLDTRKNWSYVTAIELKNLLLKFPYFHDFIKSNSSEIRLSATIFILDQYKFYDLTIFLLIHCSSSSSDFWHVNTPLLVNLFSRYPDLAQIGSFNNHMISLYNLTSLAEKLSLTLSNSLFVSFWFELHRSFIIKEEHKLDSEVTNLKYLNPKDSKMIARLYYMIRVTVYPKNDANERLISKINKDYKKFEQLNLYLLLNLSDFCPQLPKPRLRYNGR